MGKYSEAIIFLVFALVILVFVTFNVVPKAKDFINANKELQSKSVEYADMQRKLETLKASEVENMAASGQQLKKIYAPSVAGDNSDASFAVLFDDIVEMAKYNGVRIYSIKYLSQGNKDAAGLAYNYSAVSMELVSDYADLGSFLKDIYKYPYLVEITTLESKPYNRDKKILLTTLGLNLYASK